MTFEFYTRLSQSFSQLLDDANDHDIIIKVGGNSNTKEFRAHSYILKARSPYFKRALSQDWAIKKNNMYNFTKPNISPITFEIILRYMYTGILDLKGSDCSDILDLLVVSDELLIEELVTFIQDYFYEYKIDWLRQNSSKVFHTVIKLESCKKLQEYCYEIIYEFPKPFLNSLEFPRLEKSILLELVKQDLIIEEIELWNYLFKWGIVHTPELEGKSITDLSKWDEEDFLALKNTLNPFISHVRFFDISSRDFHTIIWPFKKVLPEILCEDVLSFHMAGNIPENKLPSRNGIVTNDSVIIRSKHAAILVNWALKKDDDTKIPKNKYKFQLIHRGSNDGFSVKTMRSACSNKGPIFLIVKIKENGTIIGGFNPLGYKNDNYYGKNREYFGTTNDSFIFSLGNNKDCKKIISRVTNEFYAICESRYTNLALSFGNSDLIIKGTYGTCKKCYYQCEILDTDIFSIEEIEIFKFYVEKNK
ncbi:uncharacterized protein OCT59_006079 [Rhizophagus irregularis]|uniref:Serine-enriched protein n=2 Tax=Rhizophagus irregularis TaxID=588596 RepID=A0A015JZ58_RHIIW|nr:hypothetical protein GLOIN_2v1675702 [Rhizophagus irregularis DAOM 181602=DAOM 197198]EXX60374.1 hypothetical protein RirG_180450 [Rhizophagus irregularis DAOM 197198w]POG64401.1 hypothetical protein GLOIN_2v1675702 [Rhizophagus irregularis DAOM 181602=DAOM 197198]UZO14626.1 hypothetical protein OCT59_006079 [Rhizophagus irregularis]GBC38371.1 BTB/POZ protein [Rhizophagus irregularis DAOM 181602=DAOM 197198]|eukprot:XP_025171267.1 hypothetical protein GLOIN_2v1675702 [Rhizophagus irregularis DAOM 181602=DAOM 197198]